MWYLQSKLVIRTLELSPTGGPCVRPWLAINIEINQDIPRQKDRKTVGAHIAAAQI